MRLHIDTRQRCVFAVGITASGTAILVTDVPGHPLLDAIEFRMRGQPNVLIEERVRRIRPSGCGSVNRGGNRPG